MRVSGVTEAVSSDEQKAESPGDYGANSVYSRLDLTFLLQQPFRRDREGREEQSERVPAGLREETHRQSRAVLAPPEDVIAEEIGHGQSRQREMSDRDRVSELKIISQRLPGACQSYRQRDGAIDQGRDDYG